MSGSDSRDHFKAVLLGDSGVGKTSLVSRWVRGSYDRSTLPTVGANHQRKCVIIDNTEVEVFLWDTAGQEQFQALTPLYSRMSAVAILVASVDKPGSFANIDRWVDQLNSSMSERPPVVMAVNKMDLYEEGGAITRDHITKEFGERFAGLFFVSAETNEGVDDMFMCAAEAGYRFTIRSVETEPAGPVLNSNANEGRNGCKC